MKAIDVHELLSQIPRLREMLVLENELVLTFNGEAVARVLPIPRKRPSGSLAEHRSRMAMLSVPSEVLIREERDQR